MILPRSALFGRSAVRTSVASILPLALAAGGICLAQEEAPAPVIRGAESLVQASSRVGVTNGLQVLLHVQPADVDAALEVRLEFDPAVLTFRPEVSRGYVEGAVIDGAEGYVSVRTRVEERPMSPDNLRALDAAGCGPDVERVALALLEFTILDGNSVSRESLPRILAQGQSGGRVCVASALARPISISGNLVQDALRSHLLRRTSR